MKDDSNNGSLTNKLKQDKEATLQIEIEVEILDIHGISTKLCSI